MSNLRSRQPGKTFLTTIAALALLAALSTLGVRAVAAEAALVEVEIPAGPLDRSLLAISSAFNVDILAPDELIADRRAVALSGALSAAEALDRVLQGSGLEARPAEDGAYLVAENGGETEEEPIQMAPLTVEGEAQSARFWLSDLPEAYEGGQVGSGGRVGLLGNQDVFDTPFSVTSYTSELIESQQAKTLGNVIQNDSSTVLLNSEQSGFSIISIRGFNTGGSGTELYDGFAGLAHRWHSTVRKLERVEIFKGANALLNGTTLAVGGIINLVPKRPAETSLTKLTADYDYQSRFGAHADLSRRFGSKKQFGARLNTIYHKGESAIENNEEELSEVALALEYRGEKLRLETILDYANKHLDATSNSFILNSSITSLPSAPDLGDAINQLWKRFETKFARALLRAEYNLGKAWTMHAAYGAMNFKHYSLYMFKRNLVSSGDFNVGNIRQWSETQENYTWNAGIRGQFKTIGITHKVSIETMRLKQRRGGLLMITPNTGFASNLYNPVFRASPEFNRNTRNPPKIADYVESSIAIADTMGFLDERILLTAGIRRQNIDTKSFSNRNGIRTSQYDKSANTPAVGLLVKPWNFMSLYGNYIEGLETGRTAPNSAVNAGEQLPPSETEQVEFGVKFDLDGLGLTAGVFQIEKPSAFIDANNRFGLNGEQRHRGLELNAFGELRPNLRLLGGFTYIDSELTRTQGGKLDGKDPLGVPELVAVLNLEWDAPVFPGLTLTARAQHMGSKYIKNDNSLKAPSYELYGIGARYKRMIGDQQFTFRMNIDNLLGKDYWIAEQAFGDLYLGVPRSINLSFSVAF